MAATRIRQTKVNLFGARLATRRALWTEARHGKPIVTCSKESSFSGTIIDSEC